MKKIFILTCIYFIVTSNFQAKLFSQNNINEQIISLNKEIYYLKQDNNKIKKEFSKEIDTLSNAFKGIQLLLKLTDVNITKVKNSNIEWGSKFFSFQDDTNQRFLRYKNAIKISIVLSFIGIVLLLIVLIIIHLKYKKENKHLKALINANAKTIEDITKQYTELSEKHNELSSKLDEQKLINAELSNNLTEKTNEIKKQLEDLNEDINIRINDNQKYLNDKITNLLKVAEISNEAIITQLKKEINEAKNSHVQEIKELKENIAQIIMSLEGKENKLYKEIENIKKFINYQ
ncbi:MAG TPA: hypothetical protein P5250_04585 [Bacteroidales bacterium]|nr:hypothetical protein [Bacteroidales bacterium]